jgi:outer membrane protein assembly factor BamB
MMYRRILVRVAPIGIALSSLIAAFGGEPNASDSWPQFRGSDGQGHVFANIPMEWSDKLNKAWEVGIPGKGWSSPAIADGKVWMTTAVSAPEKNGGCTLRAIAVDRQTGKLLHDVEVFAVAKAVTLHARNSLATPSPVIANGRLFVHFGSDGTACLDTSDGRIVWKNETLKVDYETGPASSPVLYKDLLIIPCDGADVQYAVALNASTGDVVWKTDRTAAVNKEKSSRRAFATPLLISASGHDQIVMPGSHCVYSYDPATGAELWRVAYNGFSNVPRPVFAHGLVFVTTGFAPPDLIAIRPDGAGDVTKTHIAWRFRKNVPNVPSPVVVGDYLFMISDQGTATCLDAKTGSAQWTERLGGTFSASLLAKGNTIYAFGDDGKTVLFEASGTFKELGRNELSGHVQATPAVAGNHLFIRTERNLVKVGRADS